MVLERFSIRILGLKTDSGLEGDALFSGENYIIGRKANGTIVPITYNVETRKMQLELDSAYGKNQVLRGGRLVVGELVKRVFEREGLIQRLERAISNPEKIGIEEGFPSVIRAAGYRRELFERVRLIEAYVHIILRGNIDIKRLELFDGNGITGGKCKEVQGKRGKSYWV
ncbi:hypothetical protein HY500_03785 [Candidatus Woesearchaeota archaeon]|nr:hypothetical protein [Candidatus Woesearchaeota archaeon]